MADAVIGGGGYYYSDEAAWQVECHHRRYLHHRGFGFS